MDAIMVLNEAPHKGARWTGKRLIQLGFLIGLGQNGEMMSKDPIIRCTSNNIYRQLSRYGFKLSEAIKFRKVEPIAVRLPREIRRNLEKVAAELEMTVNDLVHRIVMEAGQDPVLARNILDV